MSSYRQPIQSNARFIATGILLSPAALREVLIFFSTPERREDMTWE